MNEVSIAWIDGAMVTIDQRALPRELRELRITTVDQVIDAIKTLAIRGAPAIGVAGAFGVVLAAHAHTGDPDTVRTEADRIAAARPTAVNLAWGVRRALAKLPHGPQAVLDEALDMLAEDGRANRAAATHAADLIQRLCPDRPLRILTHCNTGRLATTAFGTALGAIHVLHERSAIDNVLVDETRPLLQGARLTAWELAEAGIPHRLTIDSAAAWAMATGRVDAVIVGADRITADGSVANKIGTYTLALAAHHHRIPFIVVAPESTRDPHTPTGDRIVVEERAAIEVTQIGGVATAPEGTEVFNPAFDVTPPELVTAVVTENGALPSTSPRWAAAVDGSRAAGAHHDSDIVRTLAQRADQYVETVVQKTRKFLSEQLDTEPAKREIAEIARGLYTRGWMPGTAGNVSVRAAGTAIVTGSGLSKGELSAADMVTVNIADSQPVSGTRRPSAETTIHTAVYRATGAQAVVHVHPPHATAQSVGGHATVASAGVPATAAPVGTQSVQADATTQPVGAQTTQPVGAEAVTTSGGAEADTGPGGAPRVLRYAGYELIKGLGATETIDIPVFSNHADVPRIGADIERHLIAHPDAPPVLFIAGHGITAWGDSLAQARDRAECLEAMCELATLTGRTTIGSHHLGSEEESE
ncbi:S-methyl-5-thioribose-1-phosphate isomerase [Nocardia sp. NPDC051570]|uniref:S-methyl-5-thioribose-1-phosphate isomerase n=1 Tax=Nocardia sp. NPDC051570 TaxID=3364324 RepID=UPI003796EDEF